MDWRCYASAAYLLASRPAASLFSEFFLDAPGFAYYITDRSVISVGARIFL